MVNTQLNNNIVDEGCPTRSIEQHSSDLKHTSLLRIYYRSLWCGGICIFCVVKNIISFVCLHNKHILGINYFWLMALEVFWSRRHILTNSTWDVHCFTLHKMRYGVKFEPSSKTGGREMSHGDVNVQVVKCARKGVVLFIMHIWTNW